MTNIETQETTKKENIYIYIYNYNNNNNTNNNNNKISNTNNNKTEIGKMSIPYLIRTTWIVACGQYKSPRCLGSLKWIFIGQKVVITTFYVWISL